jgi:antitoxin YefM
MALTLTYTKAREQFADVLEQVTSNNDMAVITRRNRDNVVVISETELLGLMETAHLLRSPKNAKRLLSALNRAKRKQGKPTAIDALKSEFVPEE